MPRSLRRRIRLASVTAGLMTDRSGWTDFATDSLAPATGVETTRFCRTLQRRSSCAPFDRSRTSRPAITLASDAAASTTSHPAFVTIAIRPLSRRDSAKITPRSRHRKADYIFQGGWTTQTTLNRLMKFARRRSAFRGVFDARRAARLDRFARQATCWSTCRCCERDVKVELSGRAALQRSDPCAILPIGHGRREMRCAPSAPTAPVRKGSLRVRPGRRCCGGWRSTGGRWR